MGQQDTPTSHCTLTCSPCSPAQWWHSISSLVFRFFALLVLFYLFSRPWDADSLHYQHEMLLRKMAGDQPTVIITFPFLQQDCLSSLLLSRWSNEMEAQEYLFLVSSTSLWFEWTFVNWKHHSAPRILLQTEV